MTIFNSLKSRYLEILNKEKNVRFEINKALKKLNLLKIKIQILLMKNIEEKFQADLIIENLLINKGELTQNKNDLIAKLAVINRQISELENKQKLIGDDKKKLHVTEKFFLKLKKLLRK